LPTVLLIPAYRPGPELRTIVAATGADFEAVIVVDDGSGSEYAGQFEALRATVLRHAANRGKGAALKTGIGHILDKHPGCNVVTADADGQHDPEDIVRVAGRLEREPGSLVLGARSFGNEVPRRSRVGNRIAGLIFRALAGHTLQDTQTGLRGIPASLLPRLLSIDSDGYEFEMEMLTAAKHASISLAEEPIRTIYQPGNPSSHFNPLRDSMRIGFVLARFTALSLATAVLDNLVFFAAIHAGFSAGAAQIAGRTVAVLVNYPLARRAVFLSREPHGSTLVRYLALVVVSGYLSFRLLHGLQFWLGVPQLEAKILAESALFLVNFLVQRDFVFVSRSRGGATDWDHYYRATPFTAHLTRRYTGGVLVGALRRFGGKIERLIELGGANSCFLDRIRREVAPAEYHVVDTNAFGLSLLRGKGVETHQQDCREIQLDLRADAVFSIGLIEHFDVPDTARSVAAHFDLLKPGGCAIISFPTPTWLYRAARGVTEAVGAWKFPDERPLGRDEVLRAAQERGELQFEKVLWPIVFTQRLMVFRKRA
jgi:glycosyltransferase involved in cell wall biosynthesis/SAM-dependent methyltransferase